MFVKIWKKKNYFQIDAFQNADKAGIDINNGDQLTMSYLIQPHENNKTHKIYPYTFVYFTGDLNRIWLFCPFSRDKCLNTFSMIPVWI